MVHPGFSHFLDLVFPRTCVRCGIHLTDRRAGFTCNRCRARYSIIREPFCERCGVPFFGKIELTRRCPACERSPPCFEAARSLFLYRRTGARVVHALKYEHGTWLVPELASLLSESPSWKDYFEDSVIIPVPLHPRKLRSRGYNQAEVIARSIVSAVPDVRIWRGLKRIRNTPTQTFLSRPQRETNMRNAFLCREAPPTNVRLVVVDDVLTTGATLNAAIWAVQKERPGPVFAFTLAHG